MPHAFPHGWPEGWDHTPPQRRTSGRFSTNGRRVGTADGFDRVKDALKRMDAPNHQIEWHVTEANGKPDSSAVVRWIDEDGEHVIATDHHITTGDNLAAIAKALEALHMLRRHGGQMIARRALRGFAALPAPEADAFEPPAWAQIFGIDARTATIGQVEARYRDLAKVAHPDTAGGSHAMMAAINAARAQALAELRR